MANITGFFRDVKVELNKVSWPTRQQTVQYTMAVVVLSLAVAVFLGFFDALFAYILNHFILKIS